MRSTPAAAAFAMPGVEVKGAFVTAYRSALKELGLLDSVRDQASPELRGALEWPPPASVWIDYGVIVEIDAIVQSMRGPMLVRRLAHDATLAGIAPFMQTFVQGL